MTADTMKLFTDYGVAIIGLVFVTRFLTWLIRYILERNKQREDAILTLLTQDVKHLADTMNTLAVNMNNFTAAVSEAHKFQREEHKEMINQLTKICVSKEN